MNVEVKIFFTNIFVVIFLLPINIEAKIQRTPTNLSSDHGDIKERAQFIIERVETNEINSKNCEQELDILIDEYDKSLEKIKIETAKKEGLEILQKNFQARMALHSLLGVFPSECKMKLRTLYLKMRLAEDFIGVHFYNSPQIPAEEIDYQKGPIPIYEAEKFPPYQLAHGIDSQKRFEFKNGDILITKGVSFISSTISELASPKAVYSHIVFIHADEKTKRIETIESYVGKGVSLFPIEEALKNENARILVLRPKNSKLASQAADYIYKKVLDYKKQNKIIPYDYELDFKDNSKLSCEEIAYDAFREVSNNAFIIPEIESSIKLRDPKFLKRIGVKEGALMVPADMETDSRFEIVLDWTDYRVIRDSWRKDTLLGEMFRWIDDYNYKIYENFTSVAAKIVWSTRYLPGVWAMMSKLSGIPKDFTKDVPTLTISTMSSLKLIGGELLQEISRADKNYFTENGKWMTKKELKNTLDKYRQTNPRKLRKIFREED